MSEANPFVIGALIVVAGLILLPFGGSYAKLLLIAGGTLLLAIGVARGVRNRRRGG